MNRISTQIITRTAILLALTVVFQAVGRYIPLGTNNNFIVGPLVNACLLIAAATAGVFGASIIAVLAPFSALLTGAATPLPFVPFIALGNLVLVLIYYFFIRKSFMPGSIIGIIIGAMAKFGVLYVSIMQILKLLSIPAKKATVLLFTFSWPQLVTALAGGILAMLVLKLMPQSIRNKN